MAVRIIENRKLESISNKDFKYTSDISRYPEAESGLLNDEECIVYEDPNTGNYVIITNRDDNERGHFILTVCNYDENTGDTISVAKEFRNSDYQGGRFSDYGLQAAISEAKIIVNDGYLNNALKIIEDMYGYTRIN